MQVIREIARGGFGKVEEVELDDGTRVARKVFDPSQDVLNATSLDKLKARFRREVRVQKALPVEFFVPILDSDLVSDDMWYTMPLCERNYQTQIEEDKASGTVPTASLSDILNALEILHGLGFTHRDLKQTNILIHEGQWKLADLGLVSPPQDSTSELSTALGGWGTASHMAPEQVNDFKHADPRADIFAFGCILHDIFSDGQRVPYGQQTCDGEIGMVVEKCTEVDREKRYQSVGSLRGSLFSILSRQTHVPPSIEGTEWVGHLETAGNWDVARLRAFARFVANLDYANADAWNVFSLLDEEKFNEFYGLDRGYAESIADALCSWVTERAFNFDFCDVLAQRLARLVELADFDIKARAILAMASLANSHHRFYVMQVLVRLCGPSMDFHLARRLAFEIEAADLQDDFLGCLSARDVTIDDYHPLIKATLE